MSLEESFVPDLEACTHMAERMTEDPEELSLLLYECHSMASKIT